MSAVLILAVAVAAVVVGIILRRRRGSQTASGPGAGPADATLRDEPGVLLSGAPVPLPRVLNVACRWPGRGWWSVSVAARRQRLL